MIKLILLLILSISVHSSSIFTKVLLPNTTAGVCLDGSPAAHYVSAGSGNNQTKFLLYFEAGTTCFGKNLSDTLERCYQRSQSQEGSSDNLDPEFDASNSGILSGDAKINPNFYDWNRVLLLYCDGSFYQGTRATPVDYKGAKLYFRGQNITEGRVAALNAGFNFFNTATEVVFAGSQDGGIAAMQWANQIKSKLKGKLSLVIDSSILLNIPNPLTGEYHYKEIYTNLEQIVNTEIELPAKQCTSRFPNQKWKCFFYENLYIDIKEPVFTVDTLYDEESFSYTLGIDCVNSFGSLINCNSTERNLIENYRDQVAALLKKASSLPTNGGWAPSCVNYDVITRSIWNSNNYRVPQNSIYTCQTAVGRWYLSGVESHIHIDEVSWPNNKACSGNQMRTQ